MDPPAQDGDFTDEDMELQLALALSLQETTASDLGNAPTGGAAPAVSPPAPAPAAAPPLAQAPANGVPLSNLSNLAALLSQGLIAAGTPPAAAPPAPVAPAPAPLAPQPAGGVDLASLLQQFLAGHMPPPQQQFQQQQQQPAQDAAAALAAAAMAALGGAPFGQTAASAAASGSATASTGASRAAAARNGPPLPSGPPPGWAARLQAWYNSAKAPAAFSAGSAMLAGPEQLQAFLGHLATALQIKVVADSTAIAAGTLFLKTATTAGGSREVTAESLRGLLASALLQRKVAPKDKLQAIHRVHGTLPSPASLPGDGAGGVAAALELFSGVLCREAIALLRDDGADLYFDTGAQTTAFVDALAGGSATMSEVFLDSLLDASATEREAAVWRRLMRDAIRSAFAPAAKLTDAAGFERPLAVLDRVTSTHRLQQCLSAMLLEDVEAAARARPGQAAKALEQSCVLASLFGASPMPNSQDALHFYKVTSPARQAFLETRGYPKNYSAGQTCRTVLQAMMARVQDGAGHLMLRLSRVKDGGLSREALLSWVAAVGRVNVVRRAFGEAQEMRNQQDVADFLAGGSDGFLLNVTGGCLRLAQPFVNGWLDLYRNGADPLAATAAAAAGGSTLQPLPRFADLFDKHLRPEYYRTQRHRLGDLSGVYNAQGSRGSGGFTADDDPPTTAPPLLVPGDMVGGEGSPSFMADVFFLTQLMMHVGPIPCVYRRRAILHRFRQRYQMEMGAAAGANGDGGLDPSEVRSGRDPWANPLATEMRLYDDCCESHLNEPLFADNLTAFAVLELDWMAWLSRGGAGDPSVVMRLVPEYALGDALDWLTAVLYAGRADLVASKPIAVIMRAMVTLLNANDVVRSAMLQNKIINLLLAMLASQLQNVQAREARGLALAPDRMSTGERALVGAVLGAPVTQRDLIPALLRAHVNAELVVGLDVDKDSYDKYGMRYHIDKILEELIKDSVLKRCLTDLAATTSSGPTEALLPANAAASASSSGSSAVEPGLFSDYASGIVNTVMHYFKDGLDRLADIYAIERSKADAAAWEAQPAEERQRKEDFYRGQQRAAVGFLSMGVANLKWLNTLTADPLIATAFLHEPLLGKTAFLVVSSLELLLGDACKKLQVKKPEQYGFDLPVLVGAVLALQLQLGRNDRFVQAVVSEPDYSEEIMSRALQHLETHHQALLETRLRTFLARAAELRGTGLGAGGDGLVVPLSGTADAAAGEASPGADSQPPLKRRKSGEGSGVEPMEAEPRRPTGLYCEAVRVPGPDLTEAEVEKLYAAELGPLSIGEYDSSVPGGYFKEMARLAEQDSGASRKKMRQLAKEVNDMQPGGRLALPCMAAAAIYLRQDSARVDKMRAVITGPEGTPYEGGMFVFDIFCPAGYPNDPPVMMVYNTGGGKARYNPNLYADGKVCLSLLGTYNSGHTSEKWNPTLSSLYQVLVSIQSQILVTDPMTNEPLSETMAGTAEGSAKTAEYNSRLQLLVMRHAMVDMLLHPPPGTQDIVTRHFHLLRRRIAATVQRWVREAPSEELRGKLDEQAVRLLELLAKL